MVIYIDVLIFINIIINYVILSVVQKYLCLKTSQIRLIFGALTGALFTLTIFLDTTGFFINILIKVLCTFFMCFIAFMKTDFYTLFKSISATFIFTIIFTSITILYCEIFKPRNVAIYNDIIYINIKPVTLIILSIIFYSLFLIAHKIFEHNSMNSLVSLQILIDDSVYSCIGKIDTGNNVVEPFSGYPVIVTEKSVLSGYKIKKPRIIPYKVLGNEGFLYGVKATKVFINKKEANKDIYIGIFDGVIDRNFKSIINSNILR